MTGRNSKAPGIKAVHGRRTGVALLLIGLTAAVGAWRLVEPRHDAVVLATRALPPRVATGAAAGGEAVPSLAGAAPLQQRTRASPEDAAGSGAGSNLVDVCAVGTVPQAQVQAWFSGESSDAAPAFEALAHRREIARSQLAARLAAGTDEDQVAGRLLMGDFQGAALVAARSTDGAAYRLAMSYCASGAAASRAPACSGLTFQAWSQLDPDDARPWLSRLHAAQLQGDEAAAAAAVDEVLKRSRNSSGWMLLGPLARAATAVQEVEGLGLVSVETIGREAALPDASSISLLLYCSAPDARREQRRDRCERLARWLLANAGTVGDAEMGLNIAKRVGLPPAQLPFSAEQLRDGQQALMSANQQSLMKMESAFDTSCRGLATTARWPALLLQQQQLARVLEASRRQPRGP